MLVLSRRRNESIVIDEHIVITVVEIRGEKVRLGIEAPRDCSVHRREIYEFIQRESSARTAELESPRIVEEPAAGNDPDELEQFFG